MDCAPAFSIASKSEFKKPVLKGLCQEGWREVEGQVVHPRRHIKKLDMSWVDEDLLEQAVRSMYGNLHFLDTDYLVHLFQTADYLEVSHYESTPTERFTERVKELSRISHRQ